ncbi:hypothetical protein BH11ARM2_BH11ARM2_12450 [soil metagenome]
MTKGFRTAGVAASFLALVAFAAAATVQGYTIKRVPKEGDTVKYRLKADLELSGIQATLEGLVAEKTIKVDADGTYTVESSQEEVKVMVQGQEVPSPPSPPQVVVYKPGGMISEIRGESIDGNAYRLANLNAFFEPDKPVAVGDSWVKEIPADSKQGTPATKAEYKVLGEEKIGNYDTLKLSANIGETTGGSDAATNVSTLWVSKADGSLVKSEGKWTNAPIPGAPGPVSATYSMNREG